MTQDMLVVQAFMIPELSGSKCRYIQSFFTGLEIKRASLERDFMHRPSADGVINIHTTRHKSSTQLKHTPKRHHPALRMQCRRRAFVWRLTTW